MTEKEKHMSTFSRKLPDIKPLTELLAKEHKKTEGLDTREFTEYRVGIVMPKTLRFITSKIDKESAKKIQKKIDEIEKYERETGRYYLYELYKETIKTIKDQKKEDVCHAEVKNTQTDHQ